MSDKIDEHKDELKEMLRERKPDEPADKVLTVFCARHGISLSACRVFYKEMVAKGEIKEK